MAAKKPTKKTSTRALTGPRLLDLDVPSTQSLYTDGVGWTNTNGWLPIGPAPAATGIYYENYFDMAGLILDDLTLVPTVTSLQDGLPYSTTNAADPTFALGVFDIISQERLDPQLVAAEYLVGDFPGSPGSTLDWNQLIMCNFRLMLAQTDFATATLVLPSTGGSFGSQEPSAARKLWVYRIIITSSTDWSSKTVSIPATRFIMGANVVKEDELPYMMRLKRSYEISTQG